MLDHEMMKGLTLTPGRFGRRGFRVLVAVAALFATAGPLAAQTVPPEPPGPPPGPPPATGPNAFLNLATRGWVSSGNRVLIGGLVLERQTKVLLRAVGPALAVPVPEYLRRPRLTLYQGQTVLATNSKWGDAANAAEIATTGTAVGASPLAAGSNDAAILITLGAGVYTAIVDSVDGGEGVALVEAYLVE